MSHSIYAFIEEWGIWGIIFSMFIEGSSFPFIGTFFLITMGVVMELTWFEMIFTSIFGSFLYAVGSYIPYYFGYKVGKITENRLTSKRREKYQKTKEYFSRYGVWSVAISSPLPLGNFVPFMAGISRMNIGLYTLLTMIGIIPTTFLYLSIGHFYPGNIQELIQQIQHFQITILIGFILIFGLYIWSKLRHKYQNHTERMESDN